MKKYTLLLAMSFITLAKQSTAQISTPATPLSISNNKELAVNNYVPQMVLSLPARPEEQKEDRADKKVHLLQPARIGTVSNTDVGLNNDGSITNLPDGSKVWRLQLAMPGAQALGLYYDKFHLPEGVKYFLFNGNRKQVLGAYTSANNPESGYWVTEKVQGDIINLELDIAPGINVNDIALHVNKVADYYAGISYLDAYSSTVNEKVTGGPYFPFNGSSPCEINAICPLGDSFPDQRKATVAIEYLVQGGIVAGTATLINNTRQDCTPYILTATHLEPTNSTADATFAQWLFYFNYETPTCTYTGAQPVPKTITGATFKARSSFNASSNTIVGDFLLLKLSEPVPSSYGAYFAGWDLDTTDTVGTFVCFHHPSGDVKKVSTTDTIDAQGGFGVTGTHWQLFYKHGFGEEGTSGSGLFNERGRLIGMCTAGINENPICTTPSFLGQTPGDYALYSKFSRDWLYTYQMPSTAASRLKDWLDPDNTGLTGLDAIPATCSTAGVTKIETGDGINIYPNPSNGVTYASVQLSEPTDMSINVFNMVGDLVCKQTIPGATSGDYKIDLSNYTSGMYMILIRTDKMQVAKKVILNK